MTESLKGQRERLLGDWAMSKRPQSEWPKTGIKIDYAEIMGCLEAHAKELEEAERDAAMKIARSQSK